MVDPLVIADPATEQFVFRRRVWVAAVAMGLLLLVIVGRLLELQVVEHSHYTTLSQDNRLKVVPVPPTRGLIYTRDGFVLAENRPSFSLEVVPERAAKIDEVVGALQPIIDITAEDQARFQRVLESKRRFEGVPLRLDLDDGEVARFAVERHRFPGIDIVARLTRHYPLGPEMAHIVGYMGQIDEADLKVIDVPNYGGTSHIGKNGVERVHEKVLHGRAGYQEVEVNAEGRVQRVVKRVAPEPGRDLYLNVDAGLQHAAMEALAGHRGAVVAIDPRDLGVLALASTPSYDPNLLANSQRPRYYQELRDAPDRPLFNRALQGQYPPGSTVKPFFALAALDYGVRNPSNSAWCPGWFSLGGQKHRYRCWKKGGHGTVPLRRAVVESCDVYFYRLAQDLGISRMHAYLGRFGFGRKTGVDLPAESTGLMPSQAWKRRARHAPWYPGETVITGIGQGYFLATPMQLATATAILANGGRVLPPSVGGHARDRGTQMPIPLRPADKAPDIGTSTEHLAEVLEAMADVVNASNGTARQVGMGSTYRIAGKTGTAQVFGIKQKQKVKNEDLPEHLRDHAWFIAFAPVEAPRIALVVLVEHGGSGSGAAAPIARKLLDSYLMRKADARQLTGG